MAFFPWEGIGCLPHADTCRVLWRGMRLTCALQVHQFFVHDTLVWDGSPKAREGRVQGRDCAFVVHMRNLVDVRVQDVGEYDNTTAWMWMVA